MPTGSDEEEAARRDDALMPRGMYRPPPISVFPGWLTSDARAELTAEGGPPLRERVLQIAARLGMPSRTSGLPGPLIDPAHQERLTYFDSISRLAAAVEARDAFTGNHLQNIQHYTVALAVSLGCEVEFVQGVSHASLMHDVGKVILPDSILIKRGPLTVEEREIMNRHTLVGERLLDAPGLETAREVARFHHERWDGAGYPDGRARREIPFSARIVAVADVYDALTSERPYKRAWDPPAALEEIQRLAGTHFDPDIVDRFGELWLKGELAA